jgi:hypothetical protein
MKPGLRRILAIAFVAFVCVAVGFSLIGNENSLLAERLGNLSKGKALSSLVPGEWDFACTISETAQPDTVASQVTTDKLEFENLGNAYRSTLFDGESGLVVVSTKRKSYALFLIFDSYKTSVIHTEKPPCIPYANAYLVRSSVSRPEWLYVELEEGAVQ